MKLGASTTRSFRSSDRAATMWKTFCPLLLMLFTFDFPRDRSARAEPVPAAVELVIPGDDLSHRVRNEREISPFCLLKYRERVSGKGNVFTDEFYGFIRLERRGGGLKAVSRGQFSG